MLKAAMRHTLTLLTALLAAAAAQAAESKLWYAKPAERWEQEALPIGNGRLGAMIFGGVGGSTSSSTRIASGSATKPTPVRIRHLAMSSSSSARAAAVSCPSNVPAVRHRPAASRSRPALTVCPTRNGAWNITTGRPSGPVIAQAAQSCPPTPSRPATTCRTATRSRGRWKARTTARTGRSSTAHERAAVSQSASAQGIHIRQRPEVPALPLHVFRARLAHPFSSRRNRTRPTEQQDHHHRLPPRTRHRPRPFTPSPTPAAA